MKKFAIISSLLLLLSLGVIGYFFYQNYKLGVVEEREELLVATTNDLFHNKGIYLDEIESIKAYKGATGVYPFNYFVVVVLKDNREFYYEWKDKDKSKLKYNESFK